MPAPLQLVTFHVHDMRIGVDIKSVVEVLALTPISRIPAAPEFLAGVIHWRGHIVPVLSLRKRLGLPPDSFDAHSRIVLTTVGNEIVGMIVDRTNAIVKTAALDVQSPARAMAGALADFFQGVVRIGEELVMLIDTTRVLSMDEQSQILRTVRQP